MGHIGYDVNFIEVDGSFGEGGGQILRTAIAFSAITGTPVRVTKIRAGREQPGLKRQHVSSLEVLGAVFDSQLVGADEGSSEISFVPGPPRSRNVALDMGTAASITLVLQAVIPAVALSGSGLHFELIGGTDVPWSPTFDYFKTVVRKAFGMVGIVFDARVERRGYYPRGGGRVVAEIDSCRKLSPLALTEQGVHHTVDIISRCAMLPRHVAERQLRSAATALERRGLEVAGREVGVEAADSPGSSVFVSSVSTSHLLGSDELGSKGRPSEEVGRAPAERFLATLQGGACVDDNLADMLIPLLAFASGPSAVRVSRMTSHLQSGLYIAKLFTRAEFAVEGAGRGSVVSVFPG